MNLELSLLFDESIKLEKNVAELYVTFQDTFPEDAGFWRELIIEERRHAALLESGKAHFAPASTFPVGLLSATLDELQDVNANLVKLFARYQEKSPSREEAFNIALKIEKSAGEIHFQKFMEKEADSHYVELFQRMNAYDKDHESRIRAYMEKHGIQIGEIES
jgi:hypothetical protein